jgi:DNA-binding Xre family transcriptional regulator
MGIHYRVYIEDWHNARGYDMMGKRRKVRSDRTHMQRLKVKEVAQSKGISMARLSRLADVNPRTVEAIYKDPYRDVAYSTLAKLARALGVDVADLIEDIPE